MAFDHQSATQGQSTSRSGLGVKRRCLSCDSPFYDLNRDPIVCVRCGEIFHPVQFPRSPRPTASAQRFRPAARPPVEAPELSDAGKETSILPNMDEEADDEPAVQAAESGEG